MPTLVPFVVLFVVACCPRTHMLTFFVVVVLYIFSSFMMVCHEVAHLLKLASCLCSHISIIMPLFPKVVFFHIYMLYLYMGLLALYP